jgi:HEAT repeat protein
LEPGDYDPLRNVMNGELANVQSERAQRLAALKAILSDPDADVAAKAAAKDTLAYIAWPQSTLMNRWLPILGGTRNPKGRDLYLWALNDPQSSAHVAAIEALGNIGDSQATELLIGRLNTADQDELDGIIRTLGKTKDARIAGPLAAVISEPTLVSTKLAWIAAMRAVAPDRVAAVVQGWTESPDAELAAASRAALREH